MVTVKYQYPDAHLFIDLRGVDPQGLKQPPVQPAAAMATLIRAFYPEVTGMPETEAELLPIYRSTLQGKRALIVLDNAADEMQVKNLIAGDKTAFILTSRRALALDGVASVELKSLSPEEASDLLRCIVGAKGTNEELRTVAKLCANLPLALRVAGDFLRLKVAWTLDQYLEALNAERLRWLKVGNDPAKDVEAVLKLSAAQLVRDDLKLATQWHVLADWPSDFAADAAAAAWGMSAKSHKVLQGLSQLLDRSLLLHDTKARRYRLHDLMKPIAQGLFG